MKFVVNMCQFKLNLTAAQCSWAQSLFPLSTRSDNIMHFTVGQLTPLITRLYAAIHLPVSNMKMWVFKSDQTATMPKSRLTEISI